MFQSQVDADKKIEKQQEIYKRLKLLGSGAYGKAYLVKQIKTDQMYVIKQIIMTDMGQQQQQKALKQSKILQALCHPNIVKFKQVYRTSKMRLNIVMEYANGGDLAGRIKKAKKENKFFQEANILDWFTQICLGVKHIHDRKIIHRDLKAQNIFLTEENTVKIGDFGVSRVLQQTAMNARTVVGSPYYLSPEIIQNKPYSFQTDIWSLGTLLYQMCALSPPFTANNLQFLALKIVKGTYGQIPNQYSYELKSLIKSMLNTDSSKRPNINKILTSRIMVKRISNFLTQSKRIDQFSHTVIHNLNVFQNKLTNNIKQAEKGLLPPPNLKNMELDVENKSQIYTSNANFQIESPARSRPFTPLIGQQKKGPNNFFNNKKVSKKLLPHEQLNNGLNFNDLMQIKPSALEQKVKLPKVNTNPSFFDRKQSQAQLSKKDQNYQQQKVIPNSAFAKKRVQSKQTPSNILEGNNLNKGFQKQIQLKNDIVGKWQKPPKMLDKIERDSQRASPIKQAQIKSIQDIKKTQEMSKKQIKPQKVVKRSDSTKRIVCPTKKPSKINKNEVVKQKKTPVIPRKVSRKESASQISPKIQIVSEQVKKKIAEQKQKQKGKQKSKRSGAINPNSKLQKEKNKIVQKKSTSSKNKDISVGNTNPIKKPKISQNKVPNKSNSSKGLQKLSQPPRLQYENQYDQQIDSEQQKQIGQHTQTQIVEEQKCNSERSQEQRTIQMYSNQDFQDYEGQKGQRNNFRQEETYSDDQEIGSECQGQDKLSLNLSQSFRNSKNQVKNQNYNKMLTQLQNIQKMIAQANGIIQTLPMFGDDLNDRNLLELSQTYQEFVRQDDSQLDSVTNEHDRDMEMTKNQNIINGNEQKQQTQSNSSETSAYQNTTNLTILSNQEHLQTLKMNLQQLFGEEHIIFIHKFLSQVIDKEGLDFSEKQIHRVILFQRPEINQILLKKYFRLIVTVIIMEQQENLIQLQNV